MDIAPPALSEDPAVKAVSKQILLQLAVRAVRRVHLESQLFSLGQFDDAANEKLICQINIGMGVEAAPETAVRDALAQEFNTSKLSHGWKVRASGENTYYGVVDREVAYAVDDERSALVDLQFHRVPDPNDPHQRGVHYPIGPVELKRALWFKPNLVTGDPGPGTSNFGDVVDDLRKLTRFARAARLNRLAKPDITRIEADDSGNKLHPHILVWGVANVPDDGDLCSDPSRFMEAAFAKVAHCGCTKRTLDCEWVPVAWTPRSVGRPDPTRWLWIALAGFDASDSGCTEPNCTCQVDEAAEPDAPSSSVS